MTAQEEHPKVPLPFLHNAAITAGRLASFPALTLAGSYAGHLPKHNSAHARHFPDGRLIGMFPAKSAPVAASSGRRHGYLTHPVAPAGFARAGTFVPCFVKRQSTISYETSSQP